ncbi:UPF0149 family protein [Alteromonas sp. 1_MG-2023]|uniref:UPF0149 family protein n=1 Tax=Alteromonas sp. 1_MG-2023 TaxID=3062669 RepID=UPI0026E25B24|nr:UPF0149 family protein [Alteromonas sp. 1_MG-2023]MDO6567267.1 UPF0149 family protein [Alteromonas sp. 1_MG-2023]
MSETARPIDILLPVFETGKLTHVLPSAYKADGMIFAVAASPEIPMPEQWMPWLIQSSSSALVDKDVDALADVLMNNLRAHLQCMTDEKPLVPLACEFAKGEVDESTPDIAPELAQWLEGLLYVHQQLEGVWQQAWEKFSAKGVQGADAKDANTPEKRLSRCLKLFTTLANVELALKYRNSSQAQQLKENLPLLWKQVPVMIQDYIALAGELSAALPNQFETFTKSS